MFGYVEQADKADRMRGSAVGAEAAGQSCHLHTHTHTHTGIRWER